LISRDLSRATVRRRLEPERAQLGDARLKVDEMVDVGAPEDECQHQTRQEPTDAAIQKGRDWPRHACSAHVPVLLNK
jgi:hypothetical protein